MKRNFSLSAASIVVVALVMTGIFVNNKSWKTSYFAIASDVHHYYAYLPATFIHKDISLKFVNDSIEYNGGLYLPIWQENGNGLIMTTMGMSILYAPFFSVGHLIALNSDFPANGFSVPYLICLQLGGLFFLIIGLVFTRRLLKIFFEDVSVTIILVATVFGTNLYWYSLKEPMLTHVYSFALFAAFAFATVKWHQKPGFWLSVGLGILAGLISLVRPTNAIIGLFFVFYGVTGLSSVKHKLALWFSNYGFLLMMIMVAFLVWMPQLFYWKYITGNYFVYSYGEQGFFFDRPNIINGLFSYRKGWLIYTPLMLFIFPGFYLIYKRFRLLFIPLMIFFVLNIYIVFSWYSWWYGGGLSIRPLVDGYSLMALLLGAFVNEMVINRRRWLGYIGVLLFFLTMWMGALHNYQYSRNIIHWAWMTDRAYWGSFLKTKPAFDYWQTLEAPTYPREIENE